MCKSFPPEFAFYLEYCRNLKFDDAPNYKSLRESFSNLFRTLNFAYDYVFDWTLLKQKAVGMQQQSHQCSGGGGLPGNSRATPGGGPLGGGIGGAPGLGSAQYK